jgi:nitrite reductase (NADH) small subunit
MNQDSFADGDDGFRDVADVSEIPPGTAKVFEVNERAIAVFHHAGQYFAIDDMCPHMGASLATGYVENCVVACPWHAWRFDLRDGTWMENPRVKTDAFPVRVVGTRLQIKV